MARYICNGCGAVYEGESKPTKCPSCGKNRGFTPELDRGGSGGGYQFGQEWTALQNRGVGPDLVIAPLTDPAHINLVGLARRLRIGVVPSQAGMLFNSGEFRRGVFTQGYEAKEPITKRSSGICYENTFLPSPKPPAPRLSTYLIHQSLAPCRLCRRGYSNWAHDLGSIIVVAFDDAHDGMLANNSLVFLPDLTIFVAEF